MTVLLRKIKLRSCAVALLGSVILAFGLYHIHACAGVTEGGVLGATLLLEHHYGISPAVTGFVLNVLCYFLGWRALGKSFLAYSFVSAAGFSLFYKIFEQFPPLWPGLYELPLLAAVLGALFVGVGVGLCVLVGGAPTGDDALAMAVSRWTKVGIQWAYLVTDLVVLALSLTYIPPRRMIYSLLTVVLSGQIIGLLQKLPRKKDAVQ